MADEFTIAALYGIKAFNNFVRKKVKEKIGIEKLIELLNEYEGQDTWSYDEEMGMPYYGWGDDCDYEAYLISKKYGFIEWLVENEKIDIESYCRITSIERKGEKDVYRDEVDSLLMLLAIQDEPIRFLVSILK